jgi:predicted CxxxxCH...CXXCH cytochrome family protein
MGATRKIGMIAVVVTVLAGGSLAFARAGQDAGAETQAAQSASGTGSNYGSDAGVQPIAFPHQIHAETNQIDCQYCHFSAERSFSAGIPPVSTCMGCHSPGKVQVQSEQGQQQIEVLTQYWNDGEPIPWVRIHKVADHVKFPHLRHVNAAIDCTQCHGPVQAMGVWQEPDPAWGDGKMGWCISCHVEQDVSRDCTVCHY